MTLKDVQQLSLWEHAAESGRFAEYAGIGTTTWPWNLVGKGLLSCATLLGGVAEVAQVGHWSSGPAQGVQSAEVSRPVNAPEANEATPVALLQPEIAE